MVDNFPRKLGSFQEWSSTRQIDHWRLVRVLIMNLEKIGVKWKKLSKQTTTKYSPCIIQEEEKINDAYPDDV